MKPARAIGWSDVAVKVLRSSAFSDAFEGNLFQLTSDIRFSPALYEGLPVAVNVVWLLEQATVHGDETVPLS